MATPSGRSLQAKLMTSIMVLAAALALSASYLGARRETQDILAQVQTDGVALARSYALSAGNAMMVNAGLGRVTGEARRSQGIRYLKICDTNRRIIAHTDVDLIDNIDSGPLIEEALGASITVVDRGDKPVISIERTRRSGILKVALPIIILNFVAGALEVGLDLAGISQAIAGAWRHAAMITAIAFALGSLVAYLFARTITRPVKQLVEATQLVASGDLSRVISVTSRDEIGLLAESFNLMTRELAEAQHMQKRMFESEKLVALGEMSAGVAHEIRNPLGSIRTCASRIEEITPKDQAIAKYASIVSREADRVDRLIRQLLNFTRPAPVDFQYVDLTQIIDEALGLALLKARLVGITAEVSYDPSVPMVFADAGRLQQAMLNLMFNSIDAMPSGGTLTIVTQLSPDSTSIEITVADTGEGIPEESADRVFTPFFTTRSTGTGLGLAVVAQVVSEHNGAINFTCRPGGGTVFRMTLPTSPARCVPCARS